MLKLPFWSLGVTCVIMMAAARPVFAQSPQTPPPAQPATAEDDLKLRPAEPEFTITNLPTTLVLPEHKLSFRLTHRFLDNLRAGTFSDHLNNLFGLDNGAVVGLELRFAPIRRVQAIFHRSSFARTIQFAGQWDFWQQRDGRLVSVSGLLSIEGTNNFRAATLPNGEHDHSNPSAGHKSPAIGFVFSRTLWDQLAVYAVPVFVGHTLHTDTQHRNTSYIGIGGRLKFTRRAYLVGEMAPRMSGYQPGDPEYAFGVEERVGGHTFQLTFTNSIGTTYGQIAQGGFPTTIYMGFNIGRKFY